jgi:hypothetical protein
MKAQLDQRQKALEELQDAARKQGFGSAVYDPKSRSDSRLGCLSRSCREFRVGRIN